MKHLWLLIGLLLSGCLGGLTDQQTGEKRTIIYDESGTVVSQVIEQKAIGDKYTEYSASAPKVAKEAAAVSIAQVKAIGEAMKPIAGEDPVAGAYKQALGLMALGQVKNVTPQAVSAIHYGKDGYDVSSKIVGIIPGLALTGVGWKAIDATEGVLTTALKESGDTTSLVMGDGNQVDGFNKSEVDSEVHATAIGDESDASVNDPNASADVNDKKEKAEEEEEEEESGE